MADYGHQYTEEQLKVIERRLNAIYSQANREASEKLSKYLSEFEKEDKFKAQQVKDGIITKREYTKWRSNKIMTGKRYRELADTLAADFARIDQIAISVIKGHLPDAYAENFNWSTYIIEKDSLMNTAFTLYDRSTVERLVRDNPDLLPAPKVDLPKDQRWNKQKITSAIAQGVLQGESIPQIAKRLQNVEGMNKAAATRNARTAMTGAQNAGRVDSYTRAEELGIELEMEWSATLDNRTRHMHALLDGDKIEVGGTFKNGCRFPGDPKGPADQIYNCRCALIPAVKGVNLFARGTYGNGKLGDMSYDEWKEMHRKALEEQEAKKRGKKN